MFKVRRSSVNRTEEADMGIEENKAVVRRLVSDFLSKHDLAAADDIFADGLIDHQGPVTAIGRENVKQFVAGLLQAFPDLQFEIGHLIAEGEKVCVNVIGRGTHRGEFRGVAPTGRPVTILGTSIMRIADGKIAERWNITDMAGLMQQLAPAD
jgi:steroid delta-isomerase-like uncharacterized protein